MRRHHKRAGLFLGAARRRYFTDPIEGLLTTLGVGSQTALDIAQPASGALIGAGLGAGGAAIAGGNIGEGALIGGAVGGVGGALQDIGVLPSSGGATPATDPTTGAPLTTPTGTAAGSAAAPAGVSAASAAPAGGVVGATDLTTDPLQQELTAAGINATGSNAAAQSTVDAALGTGGPPPAPVSSGSKIWSDLTGGNVSAVPGDIGSAILKNPGAAVAGGGLLLDMAKGDSIPGVSTLTGEAGALAKQGKLLSSYLQTGNLPPGVKTAIDQATASAIAGVRGKYASMGMPGSTAEMQEINNIRMQAATQGVQVAENLLQTGINETGLATGIYENLVKINEQQAATTGAAIASFAQALSGFVPGKTIQIAA